MAGGITEKRGKYEEKQKKQKAVATMKKKYNKQGVGWNKSGAWSKRKTWKRKQTENAWYKRRRRRARKTTACR